MPSGKGCKELFQTPVHWKMSPAELSHTVTYQTSCHHWKEKAPNIHQGTIESHSGTSAGPEENTSRRQSLCSSPCFPHATLIVLAAALWKHSRVWPTHRGSSERHSASGNSPLVLLRPCSPALFKCVLSTMFSFSLDKNKQWCFGTKIQFHSFLWECFLGLSW